MRITNFNCPYCGNFLFLKDQEDKMTTTQENLANGDIQLLQCVECLKRFTFSFLIRIEQEINQKNSNKGF